MTDNKPEIFIFKNPGEIARSLAEKFSHAVNQAAAKKHHLYIALSGGSTPELFFQTLASSYYQQKINWQYVRIFWGDERCEPPDHPDSNYGMTKKTLLDHITIPNENIYRIAGENDPVTEANRYAGQIIKRLPAGQHGLPAFDWIFLGLGEDGHTASIFPYSDVMTDQENVCAVAVNPKTGQKRITLTLPVINQAKHISFLVTGKNKASAASNILTASSKSKFMPASLVKPFRGIVEWYLDHDAGSIIQNGSAGSEKLL